MAKSSAKKTVKAPAKKVVPVASVKKPATKAATKPSLVKKTMVSAKPATKTAVKTASKKTETKKVEAPKAAPKPAPKPKRHYKPAKLPADYKPTLKEEYMNPLQEEYFRQKLLGWRKSLMAESRETLDHLHEENWHQADIADRASLETEAGVELRTRNRYLKLISKIDAAIRRIEDGEYGYCEETGEPIGIKRLEARPVATLSIEAQERHEKMERQYVDED